MRRGSPLRNEILQSLQNYSFVEPEHQAVFQALCAFPPGASVSIEQLTVKLNNRGFPDIELERYFTPSAVSDESLLGEVLRLLEAS